LNSEEAQAEKLLVQYKLMLNSYFRALIE